MVMFDDFISANCQAYMALNDVDAAVESFKKALELEPNDGNSICNQDY